MIRKLEGEYGKSEFLDKTENLSSAQETVIDLQTEDRKIIKGTDKFKHLAVVIS